MSSPSPPFDASSPDGSPPDASPLDWSEPAAPRSRLYGDVYYSLADGLAESRAVFLAGCGLPEAWRARTSFVVGELGFGTGLNIAALLDLWRREGPAFGRLHVFSIEAHPLARAEAARALSAWPELADAATALLTRWPGGETPSTPGFHRIELSDWNATLDLAVGDAAWALDQWRGAADAWFLDGFSPALNPGMWSEAVLDGVAARSAPGARLATFTVAGAVRRGLAARGFQVDKRPGHGRKRERLEAVLPGPAPTATRPARVAIVGAGVAGASLARALSLQGCAVTVIEAEGPGSGASGFPAALVTPRLDAGDDALAGLFAQMLARAGAIYADTPGAVISHGVLRLEHAERDARRFDRIADQSIWPAGAMRRLNEEEVAERLGEPAKAGALWMDGALTVRPAGALAAWLEGVEIRKARAAALERAGAGWRLLDEAGEPILEADVVALAGGDGTRALAPDLGLSPVRGQAEWADGGALDHGVTWGGYAVPTADGVLFGATHDRGDDRADVRDTDSRRNLDSLAIAAPGLAENLARLPRQARAAVRAVTPDRLPVAGRIGSGLFVLGGLGSRGFAAAPLLAEHMAALILDRPSPLPADLARRIDPSRPALSRNPQGG